MKIQIYCYSRKNNRRTWQSWAHSPMWRELARDMSGLPPLEGANVLHFTAVPTQPASLISFSALPLQAFVFGTQAVEFVQRIHYYFSYNKTLTEMERLSRWWISWSVAQRIPYSYSLTSLGLCIGFCFCLENLYKYIHVCTCMCVCNIYIYFNLGKLILILQDSGKPSLTFSFFGGGGRGDVCPIFDFLPWVFFRVLPYVFNGILPFPLPWNLLHYIVCP